MSRIMRLVLLSALVLTASVSSVYADRRYFLQSYTSYLAPAGTLEFELHMIARNGQGDSTNTSWENRAEFEYALTDRLTGAFYMNFEQGGGGASPLRFDGPSIEMIYRLAEHGRIPLDPAAYLEVRENGVELEIEPKLLLTQRQDKFLAVANVVGEFESHHGGEEVEESEKTLRLTTGLSREVGPRVALGLEAAYERQFAEEEGNPWAWILGPTVNFQAEKIQFTMGWHPQLAGSPKSTTHLDLRDFPRSQVRFLVGVDL